MSVETINALGKLGSYALALGVLVWALYIWQQERSYQAQIEDKYRQILVDTVIESIRYARQDGKDDFELIQLLLKQMDELQENEKQTLLLLDKIHDQLIRSLRQVKETEE